MAKRGQTRVELDRPVDHRVEPDQVITWLEALHQSGPELMLLRDRAMIARRVLEIATRILRLEVIGWGMVDEATGELAYDWVLVEGEFIEPGPRLPLAESAGIGPALIPEPARPRPGPFLVKQGTAQSELVVPMQVAQRTVGVLHAQSSQPGRFTPADRHLLQILADQAAAVLENARLYEETRHWARQLAVLHEMDQAISASLRIDEIYQAFAQHAAGLFAYDVLLIILAEGEALRVSHAAGSGEVEQLIDLSLADQDSATLITEPLLRHDVSLVPRFVEDELLLKLEVRSVMKIPLRVKRQIIGTWSVGRRKAAVYDEDDLTMAQSMADQLAIAIENAHLYEAEQEQFRRLQESQNQLIQVEKMAALGRLVASLAHEINNPLQAVESCLALVEEELEGSPYQPVLGDYLAMANEEIERVSTIVHRMRDFYRPARRVQQLQSLESASIDRFYQAGLDELRSSDVHAILDSVLQLANKQLEHSRVKVQRTWADQLPLIMSNPDHLKQLFLNLVLNAIDAMAGQGGWLHIRTGLDELRESGRPPAPAIRLEFSDTGQGIPPEILPRIFEPLFTTKEQGSGFGLFTSYKIVEAQQGQIRVDSQEGIGTTFTILLPVDRV